MPDIKHFILFSLIMVLPGITSAAEELRKSLQKNPFKQPEVIDVISIPQPQAGQIKQQQDVEPDPSEIPELKLSATLISINEPMAVVNDELLLLGEEIEGMKLLMVDEGRAIFSFSNNRYEFFIDPPEDPQIK